MLHLKTGNSKLKITKGLEKPTSRCFFSCEAHFCSQTIPVLCFGSHVLLLISHNYRIDANEAHIFRIRIKKSFLLYYADIDIKSIV